ncbi:MAG: dienelactone hydrolase family protein [Dehalococcoidia bacterium]|nr:dienelactone hydrolase family protein [Dehalococcoidia bacterium]
MVSNKTGSYEGMLAETVRFYGDKGDLVSGYLARPLGNGPYPGVVVVHEVFGLVEHTKEITRKFAQHGYIALAPDLYYREMPGGPNDDVLDGIRKSGGIPDARVLQDLEGVVRTIQSVATWSGKIGSIGYCSGGRISLMFACNTDSLSAAVDCYGGRVVTDELTENQPKPVVDMVANLSCPLLGLFGESDQNPSPEHVARLRQELEKHHKDFELQSYPPDTGHGFFGVYKPGYRQPAAVDGWQRIFDFFGKNLH